MKSNLSTYKDGVRCRKIHFAVFMICLSSCVVLLDPICLPACFDFQASNTQLIMLIVKQSLAKLWKLIGNRGQSWM